MSEIEKLYENANIKKEKIFWCGEYDCLPKEHPQGYQINCFRNCGLCSYTEYKYVYPPFTAEKQIELIKWLVNTIGEEISISGHRKGDLYWMSTNVDNKEQASTFEETLAKLINAIWQDLTEEECKQIKDILE